MDFKNIYYRPHTSYLFNTCPSSAQRSQDYIKKNEAGLPAVLGNACDEIFKEYISQHEEVTDEVIAKFAKKHGVAIDGYEGIGWRIRKLEKTYKNVMAKYFSNPTGETTWETELNNGYKYSCKPDLHEVFEEDNWAVILELKMGEVITGWEFQARDYAVSILKRHPYLEQVFVIVFAPVADYYDVKVYSAEEIKKIEDETCEKMKDVGRVYVVNEFCKFCPSLLNCAAIKQQIDPMQRDLLSVSSSKKSITADDIIKWRGIMKATKKIVELYENTEKLVLERMGTIPLGNGTELYFKEIKKKEANVSTSLNVLVGEFNVEKEKFISKLNIRNADVEELVGDVAPKGKKGFQIKAAWKRIKEEGGLQENIQKKISVRAITNKIEGEKNGQQK